MIGSGLRDMRVSSDGQGDPETGNDGGDRARQAHGKDLEAVLVLVVSS